MAHTNPIHPSRTAASEPTRVAFTGTIGDAGAGDAQTMRNGRKAVLHVFNVDASAAMSVRVITQSEVEGNAIADPVFTITAAQDEAIIGPFNPDLYNNSEGNVEFYVYGTDIAVADCFFTSYYLP